MDGSNWQNVDLFAFQKDVKVSITLSQKFSLISCKHQFLDLECRSGKFGQAMRRISEEAES